MIGDDLRALRKARGHSLRHLAERCGMTHEGVRYVESGRGFLTSAETIAAVYKHRLALVYGNGKLVRLHGSIGRQLAAVRRLLDKSRADIIGISLADITAIETDAPRTTVAMAALYARLLGDADVSLSLELRPIPRPRPRPKKETTNVHRHHC